MLRTLAIILIGALIGHFGQCTGGTCPLTSMWWRGALYGAAFAAIIAFGHRTA